ncbi:hypothetical protein T265_00514 [Opisthorchis viverrini]|uniref:Uncharacterized protein n=1 Tax=Opisthorchis viverrini TaxID=6198 RepID=A0A075A1M7_OPIVI|nr:hypothetical protein T265_00514 [Opisthorchis viverrini]KER33623.1 hypothetical protein T265_00514 [Opisthorchis viverrini]
MKEIMKRLGAVSATRLPGWGTRGPHCTCLETLRDMVANRCLWCFCCQFLSRLPEAFMRDSTESLVYDVLQLNVLHTGRLMFQLARYSRYRSIFSRNKLLTRLLRSLRQPTTGFVLLFRAHQLGSVLEFPRHIRGGKKDASTVRFVLGESRIVRSTDISLAHISPMKRCIFEYFNQLKHEAAWCRTFSCLETSQSTDSAGFQTHILNSSRERGSRKEYKKTINLLKYTHLQKNWFCGGLTWNPAEFLV